jgi:GPH family glycoside/pentoside/hexuronide:cation symporter
VSGAHAVPPARRLPQTSIVTYGFGAAAYGVKDAGFGTFLLLFYNQTIGLPPGSVGLVIMCALLVDAMIDPAVGFLSDRTRGRWGRRHPWMYASALPIAVGWLLLWNPPEWSEHARLFWLFGTAVLVRSAVSCYEVPAAALTPELSGDYDERTRITAWRYLFGWAGGLTILITAYTIFLAPNPPTAPRSGFAHLALLGAAAMVVAILVSAIGTHREIRHLPVRPNERRSLRDSFAELIETVRNKAFLILIIAGIAAYTNQGISYALSNYLYSYVWGIKGPSFVWVTLALFAGVIGAFVIAPRVGRRGTKKNIAAAFVVMGASFTALPYVLRIAGLFPLPGSPILLPILLVTYALGNVGTVTALILAASMAADVTEDSEAITGRRSEGVFSAGWFFVQKCTSGIGIFFAGLILAAAQFPAHAAPGAVPIAAIDRLTLIYAGLYLALGIIAALVLLRFPFGRAEHEARLARLAAGAGNSGTDSAA